MSNLSIAVNEKVLLKILKYNPDYLIRFKENFFQSIIGITLFETFKVLFFEKKMKLTNENIILIGNNINNSINESVLASLEEVAYNLEDFDEYYFKLKKSFYKEKLNQTIFNELQLETVKKDDLNLDKIKKISNDINCYLNEIENDNNNLLTYGNMLDKYEQELKDQLLSNSYSFGCSHLDKILTLKARPSYITSIVAASGIAKSSYALYLISKQINKNIPNAYFSLENDNFLTTERLVSSRTETSVDNMINDRAISENFQLLLNSEKRKALRYKRFYFCEEASISISVLEAKIIQIKKMLKTDYLLVTVDLASMLSDFGTKPIEIEESMNKLHYIARRQNVHFVLVFQLSKEGDNTKVSDIKDLDKLRPSINTIKNSGAIRERSRVVLGLFRKKHYAEILFPENPLTNLMDDILEVFVLKQNQGSVGCIKYLFNPKIMSYTPFIENTEIDNN